MSDLIEGGDVVETKVLRGGQIERAVADLACLRISVFRSYPYLYDGDMDYERRYLGRFAGVPRAFVVAATSEGRLVGAATACPMEDHEDGFSAPLAAAGIKPTSVYYCAESVLLPEYRGQGLGHRFFDAREAEGRALGRAYAAFASVVRPENHPERPLGYRPLDAFWYKRGYSPIPGAVAQFAWRDVGRDVETMKPLQLWMRRL